MRTTITLDADVEALINTAMREKGISFKEVVNSAIRAGLCTEARTPFHQRTFAMGFRAEINYDKALEMAASLENQELLHKLATGK